MQAVRHNWQLLSSLAYQGIHLEDDYRFENDYNMYTLHMYELKKNQKTKQVTEPISVFLGTHFIKEPANPRKFTTRPR